MKHSSQSSRVSGEPELLSMRGHQPEILRLFEDILREGADLRVCVTGRSMLPFLKDGEVLTIRRMPGPALQKGDLILFRDSSDLPVLHRILKIRKTADDALSFRTKGDALTTFDEEVRENNVLGKVCAINRPGPSGTVRHIKMDSIVRKNMHFLIAVAGCLKSDGYYFLSGCAKKIRGIIPGVRKSSAGCHGQ